MSIINSPVILLFNLTVNGDHVLKVLNDLVDSFNGPGDAVLGALEAHLVAIHAVPGEAHHHAAELLADATEDLATPGHKVLVILWRNCHRVLDNVVQLHDLGLHDFLGLVAGNLGADYDDGLLVSVVVAREDDPGASVVPDLLDVDPGLADEELVVLGLGLDLHSDPAQLLLLGHLLEQLDGLLHVFSGPTHGHHIRSRLGLGELNLNLQRR